MKERVEGGGECYNTSRYKSTLSIGLVSVFPDVWLWLWPDGGYGRDGV